MHSVICMFTGYTFCIQPYRQKSMTVLKACMHHVYCKHGGSLKILSDNGTEFKNSLWEISIGSRIQSVLTTLQAAVQWKNRIIHYFLKACMV